MSEAPSGRGHGVLVTGTDTGVGKTWVAGGLIGALRDAGIRAAGFKPVETGVAGLGEWPPPAGTEGPWPPDGAWLAAAGDGAVSVIETVPQAYAAPLAPMVAAREAGRPLDMAAIRAGYAALAARFDVVVAEGAGGLAVPLAKGFDFADLAREYGWPLIVVCRPSLGTLNHTVLTVRYAESKGLRVLGLVVNGMPTDPAAHARDPALASNVTELAALTGRPVLATLPWRPDCPDSPRVAVMDVAPFLDPTIFLTSGA